MPSKRHWHVSISPSCHRSLPSPFSNLSAHVTILSASPFSSSSALSTSISVYLSLPSPRGSGSTDVVCTQQTHRIGNELHVTEPQATNNYTTVSDLHLLILSLRSSSFLACLSMDGFELPQKKRTMSSSSHTGCGCCRTRSASIISDLSWNHFNPRFFELSNCCWAHGHGFRCLGAWKTRAIVENSVVSTPVFHSGRTIIVVEEIRRFGFVRRDKSGVRIIRKNVKKEVVMRGEPLECVS